MEAGSISARSGYGDGTRAADAPTSKRVTDVVENTFGKTRELAARVNALAYKMFGPESGVGKPSPDRPSAEGVMRNMEYDAYATNDALVGAHAALDRIEAGL